MFSEVSEPDHRLTAPIRRLRVVPNPNASLEAPVRTGGRHRKPDPEDEVDAHPDAHPDAATDVVPAQRLASLTVPPPVA